MSRLILFVFLALFWVLLTWANTPWPYYAQDIGVGLIAAVLVAWTMGETQSSKIIRWLNPIRYMWAIVYLFVLAVYIVKANLEVASSVVDPRMPIRPGIVKVRTRLRDAAARTVLGNSVTLCPGTLTLDIWENGTMMIHCIHVPAEDEEEASRLIIGRFEWFIAKIFE